MNIFCFSGNLGKDAKVHKTTKSTLCVFPVAVTSGWGDNQKTTWVNCKLWGKRADGGLPAHLTTGTKVAITGELTLEKNEHEGKVYTDLCVDVNTLDLFGQRTTDEDPAPAVSENPNDDIPF